MAAAQRVQAVVLDWAGTAVDYGCFGPVYALQSLFKQHKMDITLDEAKRDMGLSKIEHLRRILDMPSVAAQFLKVNSRAHTEADVKRMYADLEPLMLKMIPSFSTPIGGLLPALSALRSRGVKIGSSTGYTREMMDLMVPAAARAGYSPDHVATSDKVPMGRPAPWMMMENALKLNVFPPHAIVKVGDTLVDIGEAVSFGAWSIGILEGSSLLGLTEDEVRKMCPRKLQDLKDAARAKYDQAGADLVIERIADLDQAVRDIDERLQRGERPGSCQVLDRQPYLLFTPGPILTSRFVKLPMMTDWGSRESDYLDLVTRVRNRIVKLLAPNHASQYTAVLMQGSGTFGVESVIGSVIPSGSRLLVLVNGQYGARIKKIADMQRIDVVAHEVPETSALDVAPVVKLLKADPKITHVAFVHSETTTGLLNPAAELCAAIRAADRKIIVDAISSIGAVEIDVGRWDADYVIGSSNKGVQSVPGFAFVVARKSALGACKGVSRSLALDLHDQWVNLDKNSFRFTSPVHAIRAFDAALDELDQEGGVAVRSARYARMQARLSKGMLNLGFELLPLQAPQGPIITTFMSPVAPGYDFERFYRALKDKGCIIYPGKLTKADSFRIGTIGHLQDRDVDYLLSCIARSMFWKSKM